MAVDVAWLRSWIEVMDAGGFARAALRLHLSQPRISAHVASLESALDTRLVDRGARPVRPTEAGTELLPRARAVLAALDEVSAWRPGGDVAGTVRIGSFASASAQFLPRLIRTMHDRHPGLDVRVFDGDVDLLEAALVEGRVAAALRPLRPSPRDTSLEYAPLWREPFVLVARADDELLLRQTAVTRSDLDEHTVLTIGDPLSDSILGFEAAHALPDGARWGFRGAIAHQPTTLAAMVEAGLGIGLMNALAARMVQRPGIGMRTIEGVTEVRDVGIWWDPRRPFSRAVDVFVRAAQQIPPPAGTVALTRRP